MNKSKHTTTNHQNDLLVQSLSHAQSMISFQVLKIVLSYLSSEDVDNCKKVCSDWHNLIENKIQPSFIIPRVKDVFNCAYFHGSLTANEAKFLLWEKPIGSFLLRNFGPVPYSKHRMIVMSMKVRSDYIRHEPMLQLNTVAKCGYSDETELYHKLDMSSFCTSHPHECYVGGLLSKPVARTDAFRLIDLALATYVSGLTYETFLQAKLPPLIRKYIFKNYVTNVLPKDNHLYCDFCIPDLECENTGKLYRNDY